jgi:hypothetical protein
LDDDALDAERIRAAAEPFVLVRAAVAMGAGSKAPGSSRYPRSFRGRQVAMVILRHVENESGDFDSAIDESFPREVRDGLRIASLTNSSTGRLSRREAKVIWPEDKVIVVGSMTRRCGAVVNPGWWSGLVKSVYAL